MKADPLQESEGKRNWRTDELTGVSKVDGGTKRRLLRPLQWWQCAPNKELITRNAAPPSDRPWQRDWPADSPPARRPRSSAQPRSTRAQGQSMANHKAGLRSTAGQPALAAAR